MRLFSKKILNCNLCGLFTKSPYAPDTHIAKADNHNLPLPPRSNHIVKNVRQSPKISKYRFANQMRLAVDRTTCSKFGSPENDIEKPNENFECLRSDFIYENGEGNTSSEASSESSEKEKAVQELCEIFMALRAAASKPACNKVLYNVQIHQHCLS